METTYRYDEWDCGIQDYRRRWCTLFEFRQLEQDFDFVPYILAEHRALANRVRRQLNMLRPELLRKVKVSDGEELDLERAIEAMVDKKSGVSPSEHIYVQRQRKERDVAALFLLDMSASTDDLIEPEPTVYTEQEDDFLHGFSFDTDVPPKERGKTILDLEKESVVLMAEALEGLGDSYAVCGFPAMVETALNTTSAKILMSPTITRQRRTLGASNLVATRAWARNPPRNQDAGRN